MWTILFSTIPLFCTRSGSMQSIAPFAQFRSPLVPFCHTRGTLLELPLSSSDFRTIFWPCKTDLSWPQIPVGNPSKNSSVRLFGSSAHTDRSRPSPGRPVCTLRRRFSRAEPDGLVTDWNAFLDPTRVGPRGRIEYKYVKMGRLVTLYVHINPILGSPAPREVERGNSQDFRISARQ